MLPKKMIQVEKIPLTTNGKVDKNALLLQELLLINKQYTPPQTNIEHELCTI
jgi:hypothetical protein